MVIKSAPAFILLALCLTGTSATWAGQVFKCTDENGRTTFSQTPCGDSAEKIAVEAQPAMYTGGDDEDTADALEAHRQDIKDTSERIKRRNLELRVDRLKGQRKGLEKRRDEKVASLQKKLSRAYDFREKAVIESQIDEVKHDYWEDRRKLNSDIHDAEMDLIRCCD